MKYILELLIRSFLETVYFTGMIILVGLFLGVLRNNTLRNLRKCFGGKAVMATGVIGVPVHELSHAIFAALSLHKITKVKLFQRPDEHGVMGYVRHSYNQNSIYQQAGNFFIGIAPIFGGISVIVAIMYFTIPDAFHSFIDLLEKSLKVTVLNKNIIGEILGSYMALIKIIFSPQNFKNPFFYVFLIISICISSHISLSSADIKGASKGLWIIFLLIFVLNALNLSSLLLVNIIKYNVFITGLLLISVILSTVSFIISLGGYAFRHL